jgi:hypothetical protein
VSRIVRLSDAGTRPEVLSAVLMIVAAGAALLLPSLYLLCRVFKGARDSA